MRPPLPGIPPSGVVLLAACAILVAASPLLAAPDSRLEVRARLADALYLESGMGDYRGALAIYQELGRAEEIPGDLAAEALLRQGLAHLLLGETGEAEAAWMSLLELHPGSSRASDALLHLDRLERERERVTALPVRLPFDRDLGGLLHARSSNDRGQLELELVEDDGALNGVAAWRRWVAAGETDQVALSFSEGLSFQGEIEVAVRSRSFPAHLFFRVVGPKGDQHDSSGLVVTPDQGWVQVSLTPSDLGAGGSGWTPDTGLARLEIHDVTGQRSTDRGENQILLDDLTVR